MNKHRFHVLLLSAFLLALTVGCDDGTSPPQDSTPQKIAEITDVQLTILKSNPPQLSITAKGNTSSSGWSKPELKPFVYVAPPQDGIYDFDFVAVPPSGGSATVITPVEATYILNPLPETLKGVRMHSAQNNKEAMLEANKE